MRKLYIIFIALFQLTLSQAGNIIKIGSYQTLPDTEIEIQLEVENDDAFVAFQADITVPEGFKYIENSAKLNLARSTSHALSVNIINGNTLRLIGYSANNTAFTGNAGSIVSFSLKSGKKPGDFTLQINNASLANSQSNNILTATTHGVLTVLAPEIQVSSNKINFGRVALQTYSDAGFTIQNIGNQDLIISSLSFDDAQFSTNPSTNITISGGSSRYIPIRFTPTNKGNYSKSLYINSNNPTQASLKITLEAVAYAVNELHTGSMSGASSSNGTLEFTVNNMEAFTGIQFDINLPSPLSYIDNSAKLYRKKDHIIAVNTISNNKLRVIAFSATNKAFDDSDGKLIELDFHLNGTGGYYYIQVSNVIISDANSENVVSASYDGSLQITAADIYTYNSLYFGDVSILSQKEVMHSIYNWGQEPLIISQLVFSDNIFYSSQELPVTIQPYQEFGLPVIFKKENKGETNGTMKIYSNDPDQPIYNVSLTGNAFIPNYLKIDEEHFQPGEEKNIEIKMDNIDEIVAVQFDLSFPEGFTPNMDGMQLTERKKDHQLVGTLINDNKLRIIAYSPSSKAFTGQEGTLVEIPFKTEDFVSDGTYPINISNPIMSNRASKNVLYNYVNGLITVDFNTGIKSQTNHQVSMYPNPVISNLYIQTSSQQSAYYSIMDVTGKISTQGSFVENIIINVSNLSSGIYFIVIKQGDNISTHKFIKK